MADTGRTSLAQQPALSCTAQAIARHARLTPRATAIIEAGVHVTYAELVADLVRYVRALERAAVRPGMLVGVETMNRYLHVQVLLACEVIGAASFSLAPADLTANSAVPRRCDRLLTRRAPAPPLRSRTLVMTDDWLDEIATQVTEPADLARLDQTIPGGQIVRVCRTSGTTGAPKLIAMSHATQQANVARFAQSMLDGSAMLDDPAILDDPAQRPCCLCLYNLTLRSAYYRVLGALQRGGEVHFAQETAAPGLIKSGAVNTTMFIVGDLQRLVQVARPPPPGHVLQIETVGAVVSKRLRRQVSERLNARFTTYYSSVETGRIALIGEDDVGTLCPGVAVRIVDAEGRDKPLGEPGLICARTETMVAGYLDDPVPTDPVPTKSAFIDGWFRTNDMGRLSAPDRLVLLGRADDMLNVGGIKDSASAYRGADQDGRRCRGCGPPRSRWPRGGRRSGGGGRDRKRCGAPRPDRAYRPDPGALSAQLYAAGPARVAAHGKRQGQAPGSRRALRTSTQRKSARVRQTG